MKINLSFRFCFLPLLINIIIPIVHFYVNKCFLDQFSKKINI
jgi:hypothetical protein